MDKTLDLILSFFSFAMGACIASFLNVVIWRVPRGESISRPPSHCPRCGARIRWHQNIPLASWLFLRGRCARCRSPISVRYPLVELLGGVLFVMAFHRLGVYAPLAWVWIALAIVGSFIDFDHQLLPDFVTVGGAVYGLLLAAVEWGAAPVSLCAPWLFSFPRDTWYAGAEALATALAGLALGFALLGAIRFLGSKAFGREAMGMGDVFLMGAVGAIFGPVAVVFSLVVSSFAGSLVGIVQMICARKRPGAFVSIPFGPYICFGSLLWLFRGPEILSWYLRLFR
jgi:leader peptidase (prepilin peptidase)/N-methyltransferase